MKKIQVYDDFKYQPAPKYMFWLARIFGKKHEATDSSFGDYSVIVTGYFWRGKLWMTGKSPHRKT